MAFCTNCGTQVADGASFCANCGSPLQTAPEQAQQPAQQAGQQPAQQPYQQTAQQQYQQPYQQQPYQQATQQTYHQPYQQQPYQHPAQYAGAGAGAPGTANPDYQKLGGWLLVLVVLEALRSSSATSVPAPTSLRSSTKPRDWRTKL